MNKVRWCCKFDGYSSKDRPPSMGTFALLRHVESEWSALRRFAGSSDVPITQSGELAARALASSIDGLDLDVAYVSSLQRARQTLDTVLDELGRTDLSIIVEPALNERSFGVLEGLGKRDAETKFGKTDFARWRSSFTQAPPQGESLAETAGRTRPVVLEKLLPAARAGNNVLVVAHGDSLRTIIMTLEELTQEAVLGLRLQPGELVLYAVSTDGSIRKRSGETMGNRSR